MKNYKAILFDMDGTLLPMDFDTFFQGYMNELTKALAFTGVPAKQLVGAVWNGTKAMMVNDGAKTNREVFWDYFEEATGLKTEEIEPITETFYRNEFSRVRSCAGENLLAREAVRLARVVADKVFLATNPFFPMVAQETRMSWIGLTPADFDEVTSYEEARHCKPNTEYFVDLLANYEIAPEECLMIGNDEHEDMDTAARLGMDCYLVTDWAIRSEKHPWNGAQGSFEELLEYLKSLQG